MNEFEERLVAPPLWWVAGLALSLLLAAVFHGGAGGARAVLPYVVLPVAVLGALAASSRGRIRVADGMLHVPGARIPVGCTGAATALDRDGTRKVRGPLADPRAHVASRPWLTRAVRVQVEDPEDDTPYWLVGSRHPEQLVQALQSAR